ncbi:MAG: acyl carrier protein [Gammaproteobacteria bacterium]|nr:acyl carrier protein [Gammaproteobacteria bacterium]
MSIEKKVREYIAENLLFSSDPVTLASDDSLLDKGIIDSTGVLEMIFFLEQEFGIKVDDKELIPENLDSLANIARFVQKKQSGT